MDILLDAQLKYYFKMNKETKIAKENVEKMRKVVNGVTVCVIHKLTLLRWLKFLEREYKYIQDLKIVDVAMRMKITDLKNAIKIYDENGI